MRQIPAPTGKLMPEDVDKYLAEKGSGIRDQGLETVVSSPAPATAAAYTDTPVSPQQRTFMYRVKRSSQLTVPGTIARPVDWSAVRRVMEAYRKRTEGIQPSEFQIFAYCVAQVIKDYPIFRSTLVGEETIREWHHINLGAAVARPNDELVTAVVQDADTLDFTAFVRALQNRIRAARGGEDQASEAMPLILTYMGGHEITDAVPVLVAPAVGVLFIGASYDRDGKLLTNLGLTFDHRLINGVGAANFLNAVAKMVEQIDTILL
jgi:pyruvate dehydrogenase E2 component (dihydrolipoamide acetyltransferase)